MIATAQKTLLYLLGIIKHKADLTPDRTEEDLEQLKKVFEKIKSQSRMISSSKQYRLEKYLKHSIIATKEIKIYRKDIDPNTIAFEEDLQNALGVLKEKGFLLDCKFESSFEFSSVDHYKMLVPNNFDEKFDSLILSQQVKDNITNEDIDFSDRTEQKLWELRWCILQEVWGAYRKQNKLNRIYLSVKNLALPGRKDRTPDEVGSILQFWAVRGCFGIGYSHPDRWPKANEDDCFYIIGQIDPDRLKQLYDQTKAIWEKFAEVEQKKKHKDVKNSISRLITRSDTTGQFKYLDNPIKFNNKETIYYLVFECLFEQADVKGFCSYQIINNYLEGHGQNKLTTQGEIKTRIKNGKHNLFRYSTLLDTTPKGEKIIIPKRGKGWILNNPIL